MTSGLEPGQGFASSSSSSSSSSSQKPIAHPTNPKIRVLSVTQVHSEQTTEKQEEKSLEPNPSLVNWVEWALVKLQQGVDFNERMRTNKEFRNPGILEKMVAYCELDELGTNFDRSVFDPKSYVSSEYYEELAEKQRLLATREALKSEPKKSDKNEEKQPSGSSRKGRRTQTRWE
ncbi:hypothetical protein GAYE_SCF28MG4785 [Galdieria yellowstonensis]|uniref:SAP30-binding protein n=1 Tax=Galdieria yellowstonensis TaxID=3028027 RepID=A0AAV9IHG1_9RHOD|nr:hypothetical protein GAYE_SCF28MG4785 [Galdieria yellowstonensis]